MKNYIFRLSLLLSCILSVNIYANTNEILATNSLIEYTGRIDFSNPSQPQFSNPGVAIRACFTGTSISVKLNNTNNTNYYYAILDGVVVDTIKPTSGTGTYSIASGLESKTHEIEIFKLTEQYRGKTKFISFIIDEGESLVPIINVRTRVIEFVGNSITCGSGNTGLNGQESTPERQNHYWAYPAIVSRHFNARHLVYAHSGHGVYRNYGEEEDVSASAMAFAYHQVYNKEKTPLYDFRLKPDLVCINLGTNDFGDDRGDTVEFVQYYLQLIDSVWTKNNNPDIICLMGPMSNTQKLKDCLNTIVDSTNSLIKGNVYFFEMSHQTGDLGIGCGYHPTVAQHQKNAQELIDFINQSAIFSSTSLKVAKQDDLGIKVYPNPADTHFTISGLKTGNLISLYDMSGEEVLSKVSENFSEIIAVCDLKSKFHILKIQTENQIICEKIVVH